MPRHLGFLPAALVSLALANTASAQHIIGPRDDKAFRADSVFRAFDRTDSPGCALGVYQDGAIRYGRGYGMASLEHGVPNLLKYALNLNATTADSATMASTGNKGLPLIAQDGAGRLTVTFVRRKASTTPGVSYTVQFSSSATGNTFAVNPSAPPSNPVSLDATWERVTVTDTVIPNAAQPMRFARLVIGNP